MSTASRSAAPDRQVPAVRVSWLPMVVIAMAQVLMSFNVSALGISMGGIVDTFNTTPSTVGTAIVAYSLSVAAFIMLGAKLGALWGSRRMFQVTSLIFGIAMTLMTFSPTASVLVAAQFIAGATAAALVPTLVVLIAHHYRGPQQAQGLGILGAAQAMAGVFAFLIAGILGTLVGWRLPFALLIVLAAAVFILSFKLEDVPRQPAIKIDAVGAVLAAVSIILISLGFNYLNRWGVLRANPAAPFTISGLSPAPVMVVVGIVVGQLFFVWARRRRREGKTPLIALEVLGSPQERSAVYSMFIIVAIGSAVNFLIPLYIQIVQGRSSLATSVAVIPYSLSIFAAALTIVRFYPKLAPRTIAWAAFGLVALGLSVLATVINNQWSTPAVVVGLILVGLGQGSLVTLLFNVLVTSSPKELAGDVGSLRGTTNNLSGGLGTALAGAMAAGLLSMGVLAGIAAHPALTPELSSQVNLNSVSFVSNDRLHDTLTSTTNAGPVAIDAAIAVNAEARIRALRLSFFVLAGLALLAAVPSRRLPDYRPGDLTEHDAQGNTEPLLQHDPPTGQPPTIGND